MTLSRETQFYERKLKSLTEEITILQGQNTQIRRSLRQTEQYKIRYDILVHNHERQISKLKSHYENVLNNQRDEIISVVFKQKQQNWRQEIRQLQQTFKKQREKECQLYQKEIVQLRDMVQEYQKRDQEMKLYGYKMKKYEEMNKALEEQIQMVKQKGHQQKEDELESLKNHFTNSMRDKMNVVKGEYERKIAGLETRLADLEVQKDNEELKMPKLKSEEHFDLKGLIEQKSEQYKQELKELTSSLDNKNKQIRKLLQQKMKSQTAHREQLSQKRQLLSELETILIQKQKQHEHELFNSIQRQTAIKDMELEELKKQIRELKDIVERQKANNNQRDNNQRLEMDELVRKFEDQKRKILEDKRGHQRKVSELSIKLKEAEGDRQIGETQLLINSIRDLDAKQQQMSGYQNGLVFLQRQLKKCQLKLDERTRTINKLYQDINQTRKEMDEELKQVKQKAMKDKKDLTSRVVNLEDQNKKLFDKLLQKDKEDKKKQREVFKQKTELQDQNAGLKDMVEELQRDYKRVIEAKKGADTSYRSQREKNISNVSDTLSLKKQKWMDMEQQKNRLEVIYRDRQEQNKMKFEQELDQKTIALDKLKQDYELTKNQNNMLKVENQRYCQQLQINKENDRLSEYNKKMASLNLEIALTQNLYQSIIKAKSTIREQNLADSIMGIDFKPEGCESQMGSPRNPLMMTFNGR